MLSIMRTFRKLSADSTLPNRPLHSDHEDRPGYMLANNLKQIADEASQLARVTTDKDNAEPWVESKIDRAAQAVDNVHDYAKYKTKSAAYSLGANTALSRLGVVSGTGSVIKEAVFGAMANAAMGNPIMKATSPAPAAAPVAPASGSAPGTVSGQAPSAMSKMQGALSTAGNLAMDLGKHVMNSQRDDRINNMLRRTGQI